MLYLENVSKKSFKFLFLSCLTVCSLLFLLIAPSSTSFAASGWVLSKGSDANYVAASADAKVIVTATGSGWVGGGLLQTSTDYGTTWKPQAAYRYWTDVAASSDGSKLFATVQAGSIYVSTNSGASWTAHGPTLNWTTIASSSDGSHLVAAANPGQIYTSSDSGNNWTAQGDELQWTSVASSSDGTHLVAVASSDQVYTSSDSGDTWVAQDSSRLWRSVTSSSDGTKLAAVVYGNPGNIFTSSDSGDTWTVRAPDLNKYWQGIAMSANGQYLIAGAYNGNIYTSSDFGVTWKQDSPSTTGEQVAISSDGSRMITTSLQGLYLYGMPQVTNPTSVTYKSSLKIKKVSTSTYTLTITSNGANGKYTVIGKKKGSSTLTFSGVTAANGGAIVTVNKNLTGYSFSLKVTN